MTGSFDHLKPKGSSVLSFHLLYHVTLVLVVFIFRSECSLKSFYTFNRLVTELIPTIKKWRNTSRSFLKTRLLLRATAPMHHQYVMVMKKEDVWRGISCGLTPRLWGTPYPYPESRKVLMPSELPNGSACLPLIVDSNKRPQDSFHNANWTLWIQQDAISID